MKKALTDEEIQVELERLSPWKFAEGKLVLELVFQDFSMAWGFLSRVALLSEQHNHHAEIVNVGPRVELRLITHDERAITRKDVALAHGISNLIKV